MRVFHELQQELLVAHLDPEMAHQGLAMLNDALDALMFAGAGGLAEVARQGGPGAAHIADVHAIVVVRQWLGDIIIDHDFS